MTSVTQTTSFGQNIKKMLSQNIREYGMYIALFVIMVIFDIASKGLFLSARNISDLINQTGYVAVLAVGMTLIIVIRHIDLSVGYLSGFMGAVAAIAMLNWGLPWIAAILVVMVLGIFAGLLSGFLVAQMKIPAFVATLAGWLGFHGALQLVTAGTGTIIITDKTFNAIGNGFIPDIFSGIGILPGIHKTTLLLGIIAIVLFIVSVINSRKKKQAYNFE